MTCGLGCVLILCTYHRAWEPINCATRCPANNFRADEWILIETVIFSMFIASLIGTIIVMSHQVYHYWSKPMVFCRLMFISGFLSTAVLMVTFMSVNGIGEYNITCEGDYAAKQHTPFCEFQASGLIFLMIWTEAWSFFMALECYLYVSSAVSFASRAGQNNKIYFGIAFTVSAACAYIPLGAGNLGFDVESSAPFCFYMVSDTIDYLFATLIYPFMVFSFGCIVLTCATIYRIQQTFVLRESYSPDKPLRLTELSTTINNVTTVRETVIEESTASGSVSLYPRESSDDEVYINQAYYGFPQNPSIPSLSTVSISNDTKTNDTKGEADRTRLSSWDKLKYLFIRTMQYSGRQLIFVITFTLATGFIVPALWIIFYDDFDKNYEGTEDFVTCLVLASFEYTALNGASATQSGADNYAESLCGTRPTIRVPISLVCNCF